MGDWTKGPWRIVFGAATIFVEGDNGKESVCDIDITLNVSEERGRANAHLIASSPLLADQHEADIVDLRLLRRAIEEGDPVGELLLRVDDIVRHDEAALARARGETE